VNANIENFGTPFQHTRVCTWRERIVHNNNENERRLCSKTMSVDVVRNPTARGT
jgi:hypothetical protein